MYKELVDEYINDSDRKTSVLNESRSTGDWKNYAITAHALKSSSKMIGAMELSETARRMEKAADVGDTAAIDKEHDSMLDLYSAVVDTLKKEYDKNGEDTSDSDEEILEFEPD